MGFGRGRGLGRGRGFWRRGFGGFYGYPYYPMASLPYAPPLYPPSPDEERAMLEEQARIMEDQLDQIKVRLKDLKKAEKEKTGEK
jgi:hypothetical protein